MLLALFRGDRQLCAAAPRELFTLLVKMHQSDLGTEGGGEEASSNAGEGVGARRNVAATARQRTLLALLRPRGFPLRRSADIVVSELMPALQPSDASGAAAGAAGGAEAPLGG